MATQAGAVRAPRPGQGADGTRLNVVRARRLQARVALRRARLLVALAAVIIAGALLVVAAAQAEVASQQLRIDSVNQQLSSAVATNGNLELERADLSSPSRILQISEHRLGMVSPASVTYLSPVKSGPTLAKARPPGLP